MSLYKHGLAIFVLAFSMVKSCIKSGLILLSLVFSFNTIAEFTVRVCDDAGDSVLKLDDRDYYSPVINLDPDDLEHIYLTARYYEEEQIGDTDKELTEDRSNLIFPFPICYTKHYNSFTLKVFNNSEKILVEIVWDF